jgi:hypothetical protein
MCIRDSPTPGPHTPLPRLPPAFPPLSPALPAPATALGQSLTLLELLPVPPVPAPLLVGTFALYVVYFLLPLHLFVTSGLLLAALLKKALGELDAHRREVGGGGRRTPRTTRRARTRTCSRPSSPRASSRSFPPPPPSSPASRPTCRRCTAPRCTPS